MQLQLTLLSDATFGRGDGTAGLVDQETEHDAATGLPVVRGRTLKGLLVEACHDVLSALGQATPPPPGLARLRTAGRALFGVPGSGRGTDACLQVPAATLPDTFIRAVTADVACGRYGPADVLDALTALRRQTAVDDATGGPAEGTLRTARVLPRGTAFRADLDLVGALAAESTLRADALALLDACARAVHRAGSGRNRGRGRLRVRLLDPALPADHPDDHAERFRTLVTSVQPDVDAPPIHVPAAETPPETEAAEGVEPTSETGPVTIVLHLRTEQPVLVTALDGDPNSSVALPYLPGSALRGAFVSRHLARSGTGSADLSQDETFRRLFLDGGVRYLNGVPLGRTGEGNLAPAWPMPLSYHRPKGADGTLQDFAISGPPEDDRTPWQRPGAPFVVADPAGGTLRPVTPTRHVSVHLQRDRVAGRPRAGSGALFQTDALAAGQSFQAAVRCDRAADAAYLSGLLPAGSAVKLGGARSVDYGLIRVETVTLTPAWQEMNGVERPDDLDGWLVVLLLSSALIRDANGQFTADPAEVRSAFLDRLNRPGEAAVELGTGRAFLREEAVGGFNRHWNLPLPQALAVQMGSVLAFPVEVSPADWSDRIARLEAEGIGERRTEGFGRVAVNRHGRTFESEMAVEASPASDAPARRIDTSGDDESQRLAERLAERMVRRRLDAALATRAGKLSEEVVKPSPSQLQRLRAAFQAALLTPADRRENALRSLTGLLDGLPWNAREQFERDRITEGNGTVLFLQWLKNRVADAETREESAADRTRRIRSLLGDTAAGVPVGGTAAAVVSEALAYEYALRLAEATLTRAARARRGSTAPPTHAD